MTRGFETNATGDNEETPLPDEIQAVIDKFAAEIPYESYEWMIRDVEVRAREMLAEGWRLVNIGKVREKYLRVQEISEDS